MRSGGSAGGAVTAVAGQGPAHRRYPEGLGRWPAAFGLVAVVWLEIVYGASGGVAVGLAPTRPAEAAIAYSLYTLAMMALFGTEEWCRKGEVFSVYFGMFSQLGAFEARDGRLGVRRPLAASTELGHRVPGSAAVVIASIGTHKLRRRPGGRAEGAAARQQLQLAGRFAVWT